MFSGSSGSSGRLRAGLEDEEDRGTIEFCSEPDEYSKKLKLPLQDSRSNGTDVETAARKCGHSSCSQLESESKDDDDMEKHEQEAEYSPPLFIQFVLSISQSGVDSEDIVCSAIKHLLTCLAEILQDPYVPDPEQELDVAALGIRLDLVCMTLPKLLDSLTENLACLRSTCLCSSTHIGDLTPSTSYRDSTSLPDEENLDPVIEEDLNSGSDVLAHLPEYQHRAVTSVLEEMRWMLRDEIAFANTKTMPLNQRTLEFVRNHVQSSVDKAGSLVETIELNFVFGAKQSLAKFQASFQQLELGGFVLRELGDFYYLDLDRKAEEERRSNRRKSARLSRHLQLSPVKETVIGGSPEEQLTQEEEVQGSATSSSDTSSDSVIEQPEFEKDLTLQAEKAAFLANFACIFQVEEERVNMYIHYREDNPQVCYLCKV